MGLFSKARKILYNTAKALGDAEAIKKGKIGKRVKNRILGKIAGKILKKL
jgi:hypothetical protein